MVASELLKVPVEVESYACEPNKKKIGPKFKMNQKLIISALEELDNDGAKALEGKLAADGIANVGEFEITPDLVSFKQSKKMVSERKFTPSVIEPSFGMGRILQAVLEHSFSQREGAEERTVMAFRPRVAPYKVGVYRLINNPALDAVCQSVDAMVRATGLVTRVDNSAGTVGRRYVAPTSLECPLVSPSTLSPCLMTV